MSMPTLSPFIPARPQPSLLNAPAPNFASPPSNPLAFNAEKPQLPTAPVQETPMGLPALSTGDTTSFNVVAPEATQPTPPKPDLSSKHIPYSTAKELLDSRQIQKVEIMMDPTSLSDMPEAKLELKTGQKYKTLLPRETEEFIADLEMADIPYAYESTEKEGVAKVGTWAGSILKEMFGPFLLMAGTLALGSRGYKAFQNRQADAETQEAIQKARKDLTAYPYEYTNVLQNHEPNVQEALNAFLRKEQAVIVAKGLPGLGKTHTFLALAKEVAKKDPGVMTLEIRSGAGDNLRALLRDVYSGDQKAAQKAIKMLNKENNGQTVNEILLYADEIEHLPADEVKNLLVNGVHNAGDGGGKLSLPKLRMLSTCNAWPAFTTDSAVNSRIASILITPPGPDVTAKIFADVIKNELSGQALPANLSKDLQTVFEKYPGYSPRTLTQMVAKALASDLKNKPNLDTKTITDALVRKLEATPLNNTEMASLIIRSITEKIQSGHQPLDSVNGPNNLWRALQDNAETHTTGLNFLASLNGKQAKSTIQNLLVGSSLDYSNGVTDLNTAIETVAYGLKTKRLSALTVQTPELEQERTLINQFKQFLEMHIQKESDEAKKANREVEPVTEQLKTMVQNLQQLDRNSGEGVALSKASKLYQDILTESDPQSAAFMTTDKLEAIFRRVLNFDPLKHSVENDFGLIADTRFTSMFYHLKDMAGRLLRKV